MNWEAIGAIGEIVGAAAIVVTLIYLATQTKHARQTTQSDMYQRRAEVRAARHDQLAQSHPEFHRLWSEFRRELQRTDPVRAWRLLSDEDKPFIFELHQGLVVTMDNTYVQWSQGNIPDLDFDKLNETIKRLRPLWKLIGIDYPSPGFTKYVSQIGN